MHAETITLWHAMGGRSGEAVQGQCDRFNAEQHEHSVRCSFQGDYTRLMQKTVAAFRSGRQPVLVQLFDVAVGELMDSGAVVPVWSLGRPADAKWTDGLLGAVHDWYADGQGRLIGQPYNVSTVLLYVNRTRLREAGVVNVPETWEGVREVSRELQRAGLRCPFVTDLDAWANLEQVAAVQGVPLAVPRNGRDAHVSPRYALSREELVKHVQWLLGGQREGWLRLDHQTKAGDAASSFRSGECAMVLSSTGMWSGVRNTLGKRTEVTVHPLPHSAGAARHRTNVGGAALYLLRGAKPAQSEAAAAFLAFVRQPQEQLRFSDATGFLPITRDAVSLRRSRTMSASPTSDAVEAGLGSLEQAESDDAPGLRLGFYPQFRAAWKEELQRAMIQQSDAHTLLRRLEARGNALLQRYEQTFGNRRTRASR